MHAQRKRSPSHLRQLTKFQQNFYCVWLKAVCMQIWHRCSQGLLRCCDASRWVIRLYSCSQVASWMVAALASLHLALTRVELVSAIDQHDNCCCSKNAWHYHACKSVHHRILALQHHSMRSGIVHDCRWLATIQMSSSRKQVRTPVLLVEHGRTSLGLIDTQFRMKSCAK